MSAAPRVFLYHVMMFFDYKYYYLFYIIYNRKKPTPAAMQ